MQHKIRKYFRLICNFFPSRVPQGVEEHTAWATSIIEDYGFPENDSVRFALATMVMHLGPTAAYRSKFYFALLVKAGAAKQVASQVFHDIKARQQDELRKQQEATAQAQADTVASDEQS